MITLRAYLDDSGDDKHKKLAAVAGVIAGSGPWQAYDKHWSVATYDLKGPFHATDCEAQRDVFEGWTIEQSNALMRKLVRIIRSTGVMTFGAIIPIPEYQVTSPGSPWNEPWLLAFAHALINLGRVAADIGAHTPQGVGVHVVIEDGDSLAGAYDLWHSMCRVKSWEHSQYLTGFDTGTKELLGLQGADLMAREAFKHADNLGIRRTRKPVKALQDMISFHLWNKESFEYIKTLGWPNDPASLTEWQNGNHPKMERFFGSTFGEH